MTSIPEQKALDAPHKITLDARSRLSVTGVLEIESFVNGERKQHSNTRNLIFDPFHLVSYLSQALTLEPGDVIFTGTPSGVSPVHPGDVMEMRIQGIGSLINPVAAEPL